jgi:hypothetical protein
MNIQPALNKLVAAAAPELPSISPSGVMKADAFLAVRQLVYVLPRRSRVDDVNITHDSTHVYSSANSRVLPTMCLAAKI